jgi:hypothetical protein
VGGLIGLTVNRRDALKLALGGSVGDYSLLEPTQAIRRERKQDQLATALARAATNRLILRRLQYRVSIGLTEEGVSQNPEIIKPNSFVFLPFPVNEFRLSRGRSQRQRRTAFRASLSRGVLCLGQLLGLRNSLLVFKHWQFLSRRNAGRQPFSHPCGKLGQDSYPLSTQSAALAQRSWQTDDSGSQLSLRHE